MRRGIPIAPRECWGKKAVLKPAKSTQNWSLPSRSSRSRPDRKSTRLNSSHSQISYAVFCLKKKKKHNKHLAGDAQLIAAFVSVCVRSRHGTHEDRSVSARNERRI